MKKAKLLSKAEMKAVVGGVPLASYCGEGMVLAQCRFEYQVYVGGGGYWSQDWGWIAMEGGYETHYTYTGGCMTQADYNNNQANCTLLGEGGPYAV